MVNHAASWAQIVMVWIIFHPAEHWQQILATGFARLSESKSRLLRPCPSSTMSRDDPAFQSETTSAHLAGRFSSLPWKLGSELLLKRRAQWSSIIECTVRPDLNILSVLQVPRKNENGISRTAVCPGYAERLHNLAMAPRAFERLAERSMDDHARQSLSTTVCGQTWQRSRQWFMECFDRQDWTGIGTMNPAGQTWKFAPPTFRFMTSRLTD